MKELLSILGAALLLCVLPANAANDYLLDDCDPNVPNARNLTPEEEAARQGLTEAPTPLLPRVAMPQYWITIDLRPTAFAFNPQFINPEMPTPIIPKGFGLKIIVPDPPDPDSGCNAAQTKKCSGLCGKAKKMLISCEVDVQWNDDGTTIRTLICTCASPNDPRIAGSSVNTTEIRVAD